MLLAFRSLSSGFVLKCCEAGSGKANFWSRVSTLMRSEEVSREADSSAASGAAVEYRPLFALVRKRRAETPPLEKSSTAANATKIVCAEEGNMD